MKQNLSGLLKRLQFFWNLFKGHPNPPKLITLILGTILWLLGILGYFCLSFPQKVVIWLLIPSSIILLLGSIFKKI